ncbi:hypothetical protein Sste5346_004519 [Sporothrix stenoceras]|uniref:Steroid 5-alpha reductase C-terminal domain-containing protein n=1 Tax=Sporothrix stenoceras TaxID=5173 RepID=A0ABR3Z968_9PEZI
MAIHVLDRYYLGLTAIITVGYQLIFFAIAFTFKFDKVTDFAGGTNFIILAIVSLILGSRDPPFNTVTNIPPTRQLVVTIFLSVWAARLAGFLLFRILRSGHDSRFDDKRDKFLPFLGFWIFQMIWVWTVSLPVTVLNSSTVQSSALSGNLPKFGTANDIVGTIMFGIGFLCESIADVQRLRFRERLSDNDKLAFCKNGLFKWSRHPNYFGEILLQFGIFTIASSDTRYKNGNRPFFASVVYASVTGPVLLTLLLLFVSGLPLSERLAAKKRYEAGGAIWDEYRVYLKRTSILIPLPPSLYSRIPVFLKRTLLFEFPNYVFTPSPDSQPGQGGNQPADAPQQVASPPSRNNIDGNINRDAEHGDDPDAAPNDHRALPPHSASTISSAAK